MKRRVRIVLMLAVLAGACERVPDPIPPELPPPRPPAASSVSFPDLTIRVGERVIVLSPRSLFHDDEPVAHLRITAESSDTTVVVASVAWRATQLTIEARAPGEATVAVTATEPPGLFGGRSATRTAKVTVIEADDG